MTTLTFCAPRPGAWLRADIADILTALAQVKTDPAYLEGLRAVAMALGLQEIITPAPGHSLVVEVLP